MKNMKNLIKQHNARVLKNQEHSEKICHCRVKDNCPLNGKCLHKCIVYQTNVITNSECKEYFGAAEGEFKLHYNNHTMSFRYKKHVNDTELSKYLQNWMKKTLITIYSGVSKGIDCCVNVGQGNMTQRNC